MIDVRWSLMFEQNPMPRLPNNHEMSTSIITPYLAVDVVDVQNECGFHHAPELVAFLNGCNLESERERASF